MKATPQTGYLILADISGFIPYLSSVELAHAQEILGELLELLVKQFRPLLTLASLQGDAVLVYTAAAAVKRPETVLELIETTYAAFKNRLTTMHRHISCTCQACTAVTQLDLKFIIHYGEYLIQKLADGEQLLGLDVQLVQNRSLKQNVNDCHSYILFTEIALHHLGLEPHGMVTQVAEYEPVGQLRTYWLDLQPRYEQLLADQRLFLTAAEADMVLTYEFEQPAIVVWEWINDPHKRSQWLTVGPLKTVWSVLERPGGRTTIGAQNHCNHGLGATIETILDWRPFDYFTAHEKMTGMTALVSYQFEPLNDEQTTRLHVHLKLQSPALPIWLKQPLFRFIQRRSPFSKMWSKMAGLMAEA